MMTSTRPIRIVLADDHESVRQGLRALLDSVEGLDVVAEVGDSESAVASVRNLTPDVLILDLSMPGEGGLMTIVRLARDGSKTSIIVLTRHSDPAFVHETMRAGASAYVLKQSPFSEIERAISRVAHGETYVDPLVSSEATASNQSVLVSRREDEVLRRAARGQSNKEIAAGLNIAVKTVEVHKAQGMRKLGLEDRSALVRYGKLHGWLDEP